MSPFNHLENSKKQQDCGRCCMYALPAPKSCPGSFLTGSQDDKLPAAYELPPKATSRLPCCSASHVMEHMAGQQAQLTMPSDMTSRILAGFRLQTTTTRRFCIWSRGTNLTRPLTTCRQDHHGKLGRHSQGGSLPSLLSFGLGHCCSAVALLHWQQVLPTHQCSPQSSVQDEAGVISCSCSHEAQHLSYIELPAAG